MHVPRWMVLLAVVVPAVVGLAPPPQPAEKPHTEPRGSVQGLVTFHGQIPKARVADDSGRHRDLLVVDRQSGGLRHVVAYLLPPDDQVPSLSPAGPASPPPAKDTQPGVMPATVDQQDYAFVPQVLAVRAGDPVTFTNSDPANHSVRTTSPLATNSFNVFTPTGGRHVHRFALEKAHRPIHLGCDIHPWMEAWVYVFDHPYFAVTDARGRFRIDGVPPGTYRLVLKQPALRQTEEREVTVAPGKAAMVEVAIKPNPITR